MCIFTWILFEKKTIIFFLIIYFFTCLVAKESSSWLAPNFRLPHLHGRSRKKHQRSQKHRDLVVSFFIGSTQNTCYPEFNIQDFSSTKTLDCSLQCFHTTCWTKTNNIQPKIPSFFPVEMFYKKLNAKNCFTVGNVCLQVVSLNLTPTTRDPT